MLKVLPVLALLCAGSVLSAQSSVEETNYISCQACHGPEGPSRSITSIESIPYEEMLAMLNGFEGASEDSTIMHRFVAGYSEQEIEDLARYISNLEGDI